MNAKKAKKLRRMAIDATIGFPLVAYRGGRPFIRLGKCTRALYQQLKKAA